MYTINDYIALFLARHVHSTAAGAGSDDSWNSGILHRDQKLTPPVKRPLGLCACGCSNRKLQAARNQLIQESRCRRAILRVSAVFGADRVRAYRQRAERYLCIAATDGRLADVDLEHSLAMARRAASRHG